MRASPVVCRIWPAMWRTLQRAAPAFMPAFGARTSGPRRKSMNTRPGISDRGPGGSDNFFNFGPTKVIFLSCFAEEYILIFIQKCSCGERLDQIL